MLGLRLSWEDEREKHNSWKRPRACGTLRFHELCFSLSSSHESRKPNIHFLNIYSFIHNDTNIHTITNLHTYLEYSYIHTCIHTFIYTCVHISMLAGCGKGFLFTRDVADKCRYIECTTGKSLPCAPGTAVPPEYSGYGVPCVDVEIDCLSRCFFFYLLNFSSCYFFLLLFLVNILLKTKSDR